MRATSPRSVMRWNAGRRRSPSEIGKPGSGRANLWCLLLILISNVRTISVVKPCPRCGLVKCLSDFSKNPGRKDGVHSICKVCRREYDHERYERLQGRDVPRRPQRSERGRSAWLRGLKEDKPCTDCGRVLPYQVMQWDHRPGTQKLGDINEDFWGRSRE